MAPYPFPSASSVGVGRHRGSAWVRKKKKKKRYGAFEAADTSNMTVLPFLVIAPMTRCGAQEHLPPRAVPPSSHGRR
jgi:hypothetical protein